MTEKALGPLEEAVAKLRCAKVYAEMSLDNVDPDMASKQLDVAIGNAHEALDLLKRKRGAKCSK